MATNRRLVAYVDGFNFYHGAVKKAPAVKWLDFESLSMKLVRSVNLVAVNYYTAKLSDPPNDPTLSARQDSLLRALGSCPRTSVILGKFKRKEVWVEVAGGQRVKGKTWEEKGSDVNLGVDLVRDALRGEMDVALVFSNDTDLERSVDHAIEAGVDVIVVNPHQRTSKAGLTGTATRKLHMRHLRSSQLPDEVEVSPGVTVRRPATWI